MRTVRIVAEFNIENDDVDQDELREAMRMLQEDVDLALINSDALEFKGFASPVIGDLYVEEEVVTRTYNRWDL